jgi:hypothetical protein
MQLGYMTLYFAILEIVLAMLKTNFDFQAAVMDTRAQQIDLSDISLKYFITQFPFRVERLRKVHTDNQQFRN